MPPDLIHTHFSAEAELSRNLHPLTDANLMFSGGFSDVYRATSDSGTVAVKVLRLHGTQTSMKRLNQKFSQEAEVWWKLEHQNVLPCTITKVDTLDSEECPLIRGESEDIPLVQAEAFESNVVPYFISPWMEQGNVSDYLNHSPEIDPLSLVRGIAEGLEYLHHSGVVHGDLTTSNIYINEKGCALISDFGIAKILEEHDEPLSSKSGIRNTWRCTAPELLNGDKYRCTTASDVYSFACVSMEIMTGVKPYAFICSEVDVVLAIYSQEPPFHLDQYDQSVWGVLRLCWAFEPLERPSMATVTRFLGRLPAGHVRAHL